MSYGDSYDPTAGVAIIGMAGRFPGARSIDEFWRNLVAGKETISFFADHELEPSALEGPETWREPSYVKARGIIEDAERFDAAFFGINPREAEVMDPQQRVFLETAWEALEDAGYDPERWPGSIGVFAGMTNNTYFLSTVYPEQQAVAPMPSLQTMMANEKDYLATRVSYKLNLRGPSLNLQTACSTSLVAVYQAFQSLVGYQCDMALAGGVSIACPQHRGYLHHEGAIVSPDGHCRAFDADGQGTVFSNGVGIVVLKRLSDALADGDGVYAVIKGAAVNNDGSARVSFTAPSVDGQAEVIAMAQAAAGVDPGTISYVEAHGTATALGDPIELAALTQAFRLGTAAKGFCAIGSVKTNIGHLDAAAGVAGLIKTTLALMHKTLPPSLHFQAPNPKIDFANSPFYVSATLTEWKAGQGPRRAGVSSFGAGGTNAHVVVEEAPPREPSEPTREEQVLILSARSRSALDQATGNLARYLRERPQVNLADVAYTLQVGRRRFGHWRVVVCRDVAGAIEALEGLDVKTTTTGQRERCEASVAFMFPGQGAQFVDMARRLYEVEPVFRTSLCESAEVLRPHLGFDLLSVLYPEEAGRAEAERRLTETAITQPALFAVEYGLAQLWRHWGVTPQAMIGHSLGEYVAACVAEVFTRDEALALVARRARLMQALPRGSMLAIRLAVADVEPLLGDGVSVAAVNAPSLTVVSGPDDRIQALSATLTERGIASRLVATSHAFHSAMMDPMLPPFTELIRTVRLRPPRTPWVSSLTGDWITPGQATDPGYWAQQLRQPVRFADGVRALLKDAHLVLLEVGPGQTLGAFAVQQRGRSVAQPVLTSLEPRPAPDLDTSAMLSSLGRLWLAGAEVDWASVHGLGRRQRVSLPTYPFERKRFWFAAKGAVAGPVELPGASPEPERAPLTVVETAVEEEPIAAAPVGGHGGDLMAKPLVSPSPSGRRGRVFARLQALFADLSGLPPSELDASAPFLELGLDSLFLTQIGSEIQKSFGVRVSFRQLLEELTTLDSLAAHLERALPAEEPAASLAVAAGPVKRSSPPPGVATRPVEAVTHAPAAEPPVDRSPADAGALERILSKQLELMARQLDMLRNGSLPEDVAAADQARASESAPAAAPNPASPSGPNGTGAAPARREVTASATKRESKVFGPYRPVEKGAQGGLTPQQQAHLDAFIARYNARTPESKRLAQAHRAHLADPRTVAGFRLLWKEIVYPIVTVRSSGSKLWDVDDNEYVDLTNGFGMILFGHSPDFVTAAVHAQLAQGIEIGPQSRLAGEVAKLVCELTGMERVAFCNTGSEAVTAALRVARTVTGRDRIAMFAGAYHGTFDEVLMRPTSARGVLRSRPIAPGIPAGMADNVIVLDYGSPAALEVLQAQGKELAAVLVEPVQSRRPDLQPREFLHQLRALTSKSGAALIFDEVVTGFRAHPGGVQALFDVKADLATYGKVVGGGLPIGLLAGKAAFMDALDGGMWQYGDASGPEVGMTFFAGTFVRHPLALAAAHAVLSHLKRSGPELQRGLNERTTRLVETLRAHVDAVQAPIRITQFSSFFCFNFPPDLPHASLFYAYMREKGVHVWEGRPGFLTTAHTEEDIAHVIRGFKESVAEMQEAGFLPGAARAESSPPPGARLGRDPSGREAWFVPDPDRPGKYLQVGDGR